MSIGSWTKVLCQGQRVRVRDKVLGQGQRSRVRDKGLRSGIKV